MNDKQQNQNKGIGMVLIIVGVAFIAGTMGAGLESDQPLSEWSPWWNPAFALAVCLIGAGSWLIIRR